MTIKTVTSWRTLFNYAHELGQARLSGDKVRIAKAQKTHDDYVKVCLESDLMSLHCTNGDL